jgi:predicted nuclease with TOPRIM domain
LETIADAKQRQRKELVECIDKLTERLARHNECRQRIERVSANLTEIETSIINKAEEMKRLIDEHAKALVDEVESLRNEVSVNKQTLNASPWRRMSKTVEFMKELATSGSDRDLMSFSKMAVDSANQQLQSDVADLPAVKNVKFEVRQNTCKRFVNLIGAINEDYE